VFFVIILTDLWTPQNGTLMILTPPPVKNSSLVHDDDDGCIQGMRVVQRWRLQTVRRPLRTVLLVE